MRLLLKKLMVKKKLFETFSQKDLVLSERIKLYIYVRSHHNSIKLISTQNT